MAYQGGSDYRRGGDRDEDFRRDDDSRSRRGEFGDYYGRGFEEEGLQRSQRGYRQPSSRFEGRYGQSSSYGEDVGFDRERTPGGYGRQQFGQGEYGREFGQSEGYRRYGESYGRGPEGFDRETGSYAGFGQSSRGVGGEWDRFGGSRRYIERFGRGSEEFGGGGLGGSEPYSESFGTLGSTRGRFTGRGPKGYTRSDDRIREDVSDRLELHGEIDATEIEVRVENGEVTLEGTVEDRRSKRLAEDLVDDCPGVKQVHNRIRVQGYGGQVGASTRPTRSSTRTTGALEGTERAKGGSTTRSTRT